MTKFRTEHNNAPAGKIAESPVASIHVMAAEKGNLRTVHRPTSEGADGAISPHPSLIAAIAEELSRVHRATTAEHWRAARRLLEDVFHTVEHSDETAGASPVSARRI